MRLYVNIDHVATLREARKTDEPDPVRAADAAERAGADGITVHLREDRRHIQDRDVRALAASLRTVLNLELGAHDEIVRIACRVKPFQATLVPERRQEITTEGGLALHGPGRHGPGRRGPNRHGPNRKVGAAVRPSWACPRSSCTPAATRTPGGGATRHYARWRAPPRTPGNAASPCTRATGSPTRTCSRSPPSRRSRSSTSDTAS